MEHIFDTHAHYDDAAFEEDRAALLESIHQDGVAGIVNCGCDVPSSRNALRLAEDYDFIYAAAGFHPEQGLDADEPGKAEIQTLLHHPRCVAVGEIGLDYHYEEDCPREIQLRLLEEQLEWANALGLPVIIHDREAHEDTLRLLQKHRPAGVLHCFSGSVEMAKEILKLGMYIGLGGAVTFKNARKPVTVARSIPLDRLVLETDAPYMTPVPFRGKRNQSSYIQYTAQKIAEVRGMDIQELLDLTHQNALRLFQLQ